MSTQFEPGQTPAGCDIPLCVPHFTGNEGPYLQECIASGWVSSVGPFVDRFEQLLAVQAGRDHAIAVVNGTSALHIALLLAGVQPDDAVVLPSLTFIAPANAIRYAGARPVFLDVEPTYWQLDPHQLEHFLEKECRWCHSTLRTRADGRRVAAIVPVHVVGHPVDMDPILELAQRYHLPVIEDTAESLGALYKGRPVGGLGDFGCFSFNGNKIITAGGGGMLVTADADRARRARYLTTQAKDDPIEYIHNEVGYNYRLTNLQAAVGCAQLEQLPAYLQAKRAIAERYRQALADLPGITPMAEAPYAHSAFWMYTVLIDPDQFGLDRRQVAQHLQQAGIQTRPLWQPLHQSKAHADGGQRACPTAERLHRLALSLPCSVGLSEAHQQRVIEVLRMLALRRTSERAA